MLKKWIRPSSRRELAESLLLKPSWIVGIQAGTTQCLQVLETRTQRPFAWVVEKLLGRSLAQLDCLLVLVVSLLRIAEPRCVAAGDVLGAEMRAAGSVQRRAVNGVEIVDGAVTSLVAESAKRRKC